MKFFGEFMFHVLSALGDLDYTSTIIDYNIFKGSNIESKGVPESSEIFKLGSAVQPPTPKSAKTIKVGSVVQPNRTAPRNSSPKTSSTVTSSATTAYRSMPWDKLVLNSPPTDSTAYRSTPWDKLVL